MSAFRRPVGLCGLLLAAILPAVYADPSVPIAYCASINTASTSANSSIFQSDGLCYEFCIDSYAYAVVLGEDCWCSNYTPDSDDQVDTDECDTACPGYPSDLCGGDDLYGYMALTLSPSGTLGGSSSTAAATASSTKSSTTPSTTSSSTTPSTTSTSAAAVTTTIYQISTTDIAKSTAVPQTSSSPSSHSSTFSTTASSSKSSETSSSVSLTVQTVTQGGIVQTVTVTPVPAASSSAAESTKHKSVSTGAAVGIAVGVVAGLVVVAAIAFFLWRRKRQQHLKDEALFNAANLPSTRGTSPGTMNGLSVVEAVGASSFRRHGPDGSWESDQSGRRRSALMQIDPRIDPGFSDIYARADNKSRDSIGSLRDDHDYSRRVHHPTKVLRATNPDPVNE